MATNFPNSPSNGDTHVFGGTTYTYNSTKGVWNSSASSGGGASVTTDDTAPTSPSDGDLWWDSAGGKMYVYYQDADSSQWVSVSVPGSTGPAGANGSAQAYTNFASFPSSGNTLGDFAIAQDTKALYMWDGTEWDRVFAGADETPTWTTEPNSSYDLATDGTATTISVAATDPEGFPITYTHDTNPSNQNQATITNTGGTFTVTPSTTESDAGQFTLRLKASDGLHITSKSSTINLDFYLVPQRSNLVYGLDAQKSSTHTDKSGNGLTATLQNGVSYNTGTPKYYEFDGDDDYIDLGTIGINDPLQLYNLTNGYTVSFWVRKDVFGGDQHQRILDKSDGVGGANGYYLQTEGSNGGDYALVNDSQTAYYPVAGGRILINQWEMVTCVVDYTSQQLRYYKNGIKNTTQSITASNWQPAQVQTNARIGSWNHDVAREFNGRLGNLLVWSTALTDSEVDTLYTYLKSDYTSNHIESIEQALGVPTDLLSSGSLTNLSNSLSNPIVFSCNVVFPLNPSDGALFEMGGNGNGSWVGIRDSGATFRLRAGSGAGTSADSVTAFLDITSFPTDGAKHNVMWEFHPTNGTIRCWIDGTLKGTGTTTTNGAMNSNVWAGSDDGGFGQTGGATAPTGEPTSTWPAGIDTNEKLRYWNNTTVA